MKTVFYGCGAESVIRYVVHTLQHTTATTAQLLSDLGGIAYSDQDKDLWGKIYFGLPIISPQEIKNCGYDRIVITACNADAIFSDLTQKYEMPAEKIIVEPARQPYINRTNFVRTFAQLCRKRGLVGDVAEGGVYKGDYSKEINAAFPDSMLYLFDTFEGFVKSDVENDVLYSQTGRTDSHFANTSVDLVMNKLPHPKKAVICKGYFPESAVGVDGEFVFVNLDFDLYKPIKAGLEFFYPKMIKGRIILIHDYFNGIFDAAKAVEEFCGDNGIFPFPINDVLSVAIMKQ